MNDLDRKIREALRGVDENGPVAKEPNLAEELVGMFRARHRLLNGAAFAFTFIFFAGGVASAFRFAAADAVRDQLLWTGVCLLSLLCVGLLKIYFWLEIYTNRVLRELKRVELLIVSRPDRADTQRS